ncbi:hypothetical protein DYH09_23505 [bacterium CPR1]|nr:hypothetical protein [bacterium CPR1]
MSYDAIRDALKTRLEAVDDIGVVHSYQRWTAEAPNLPGFNTLFKSDGRLNTWMISRVGELSRKAPGDDSRYAVRHTLQVLAFYAIDDSAASEEVFQDLVSDVLADLRAGDRTLGGACLTHSAPEATLDYADFCGVTCHRAEISLVVEEIV